MFVVIISIALYCFRDALTIKSLLNKFTSTRKAFRGVVNEQRIEKNL